MFVRGVRILERAQRQLPFLGMNILMPIRYALAGTFSAIFSTMKKDVASCLSSFEELRTLMKNIGKHTAGKVLRHYNITYAIQGLESLPSDGKFVAVLNHPSGILDGIIAMDILDRKFNAYQVAATWILKVLDPQSKYIIPVTTRRLSKVALNTMQERLAQGVKKGKPLVIFPAGGIPSQMGADGKYMELKRKTSFVRIAEMADCPIIPIYLDIPTDQDPQNGLRFPDNFLRLLAGNMTQFSYAGNKEINVVIGEPILLNESYDLANHKQDYSHIANSIKAYLMQLGDSPEEFPDG